MRTLEQSRVVSTNDKKLLSEVKRIIQQFFPSAVVLLYGSVARGDQDLESDYDILILTDTPATYDQEEAAGNAIYAYELQRGVVISTVFNTKGEWDARRAMPFHVEVDTDGILV